MGCNCGGVRAGYKRVYLSIRTGQPTRSTTDQQLAEKWKKEAGRVERRVVAEGFRTTH